LAVHNSTLLPSQALLSYCRSPDVVSRMVSADDPQLPCRIERLLSRNVTGRSRPAPVSRFAPLQTFIGC